MFAVSWAGSMSSVAQATDESGVRTLHSSSPTDDTPVEDRSWGQIKAMFR